MAFEELLVQERLLKAGDLVRFDGEWGEPYTDTLFRVSRAETTQRIHNAGIADSDVQVTIDVDGIGLNPEHRLWAYELRLGVGNGLYKVFTRWPSNDFTRQLQDPNFQINPGDADLKLIGYSDHISSPFDDPRYRFFWVKDQLPSFVVLSDSGAAATPMFQKIVLRFVVNVLGLQEEKDQQVLQRVENGELFVTSAQHYELLGRRST